ncbi:MAG: GTP-binding protein [Planctomycetes bacterium]|nr:GTP-binding protein [Planctomycetota bacterium]
MDERELLKIIEEAARDGRAELDLSDMGIESLPAEIGQLTNLKVLDLYHNQLTSIAEEIGQLINLTGLDLSQNQLTSVPKELGQLTNLTRLYLGENQLTSVPEELWQLTNLTRLDLDGNDLASVPKELVQLTNLTNLGLEGNPLESPPPEVVKQGTEAVREYFKSLEVEKRAINEVKVLLVGNGAAGKTSLVKKLTGVEFDKDEPQTAGVNIEDWQVGSEGKGIKAHFWDFGGQDLMQATHQMFYSVRSLYVLVLNACEEPEAEDWLKHIESFGGESPILVVINKIDENQNYDVNRKSLREKYRGIRDFYRVSCKSGEGIEGFTKRLQEELGKVELVRSLWGRDWLTVKEELENSEKDYITYSDYKEICRGAYVTSDEAQKILLEYLHSLGVILHFEGYDVKDTQVLNPAWMTEAIYRILNSKKLTENKGYLRKEWLGEILNDIKFRSSKGRVYSAQEERYIADLMAKFQLCFELADDRDVVLVPDLLDEQEPEFDFEDEKCIDFHFEYDFLPKSVMPRFMVRRHGDIEGRLCWRTGAVLHDEAFRARALVKLDKQEKRIYILVNGEQRRDYFSTIRKTFLDINAGFQNLKVKQCIGLEDNDRVEYDDLIASEIEGHDTILRTKSGERYQVAELLGQIESRSETQENIDKIIANIEDLSREIEKTSTTQKKVIGRVDFLEEEMIRDQGVVLTELSNLQELTQRQFLTLFNSLQEDEESHCPNVFAVLPKDGHGWLKNLLGQRMVMQLYCQAPGQWHPAVEGVTGGRYDIKMPGEFLANMGPYILKLAKMITYAAPVAGAAAGVASAGPGGVVIWAATKKLEADIKLMEELAKKLSERDFMEAELLERIWAERKAERIEGMEVRALRKLLDEVDTKQEWGGLEKVLTPEGHYLWLCKEHGEEYRK